MASFLLESYRTQTRAERLDELTERAREGAAAAEREGWDVRHVRTFLAPADEMCFHVFEAASPEAAARASELAHLDHERITEVIE